MLVVANDEGNELIAPIVDTLAPWVQGLDALRRRLPSEMEPRELTLRAPHPQPEAVS